MAMVNSGLGWQGPDDYTIFAADTYLGYSGWREFYKTYNGAALVWFNAAPDGWRGPCLCSTVRENAYYNVAEYGYQQPLPPSGQFWYDGFIWYVNTQYYINGQAYGSPFHILSLDIQSWDITGPALLSSLGIKRYVSPRSKAFLAGLAVGMAELDRELRGGNGL